MEWLVSPLRPWARILVAVLVVGAAFVAGYALHVLGAGTPYLTFFPAIALVALLGGLASGMGATACSAFLVFSVFQHGVMPPGGWLATPIFLVSGTLLSGICEVARRSRTEIEKVNDQLGREASVRRRAEEEIRKLHEALRATLHESETGFRLLVEGVEDYAIIMLDPDGRVARWNAGAENIKGYRAEEIVGQHFSRFYPPEDVRQGKPERELKVAAAEGRFEDEGWRVRKDGSRFVASVLITALRDESGQLLGFGKITRDVTERKRAEDQVLARTVEAEAANRELESFSYTVSHNLRAPLRAISGYASLLGHRLGGALDDEGQRLLRAISDNGLLMGSLVDGLLDFTRTRRKELKRVPLDMKELAEKVVTELALAAKGKGVRTVVADLPPVHADRDLVASALRHLLTNAIRFSAGKPDSVVEVGFEPGTDGPVYFVRDNGIGFDAKYAERLFRVFEKLDGPPDVGETGIGLALVKRIVEKHGGTVRAEGEVDKGATFHFTLAPRRSGE